jgi:hypothetical protein
LEWGVSLVPLVDVRWVELLPNGRLYVVGPDEDNVWLAHVIEPPGEIAATIDLTGLGYGALSDFDVDISGDSDPMQAAVLGEIGNDLVVHRLDAAGTVDDGTVVPHDESVSLDTVVLTSFGLTVGGWGEVGPYNRVIRTIDDTGATMWESTEDWELLDGKGARLVVGRGTIALLDPDGENRTEPCQAFTSLTWLSSSARAVTWPEVTMDGQAGMGSCDLETGETTSGVVATGAGGLEVMPSVGRVAAAANGHPIGYWAVCEGEGSVEGCVGTWTRGLGGPGDPNAVETCPGDREDTFRVGADNGVYIVERDRDTDELRLVRRMTLPQEHPWTAP